MIALTFDQDWAPEWATRAVVTRLSQAGLTGTLFVTHACPSLAAARAAGLELAWHPNYLGGSSHGDNPAAVLQTMRQLVPDAVGVRAHCLVRSTPLLTRYAELGLRYEASDLIDGLGGLRPLASWNGVWRVPIYWEDDVHLLHGRPCRIEAMGLAQTGLKALTFHPVLVALNAADLDGYQALKSALAAEGRSLSSAQEDDVAAYRGDERPGVGDLFEAVVALLAGRPQRSAGRLRDVVASSAEVATATGLGSLSRRVGVLLTSVGNEAIHGFVGDLRSRAPAWELIGTDMNGDAAGLYLCDHHYVVPPRSAPEYVDTVAKLVARHAVDVVVPLSTEDQSFFARPSVQRALKPAVVMTSAAEAVERANGKVALFEALAAAPELLPDHEVVASSAAAGAALQSLARRHRAALLKSDRGSGGVGMLCVGQPRRDPAPVAGRRWIPVEAIATALGEGSAGLLARSVPGLELLFRGPWPRLAVAYLPGDEYSVDLLAMSGRVSGGVVRRRRAAVGGLSWTAETVAEEDVLQAGYEVVERLGLSHVVNVQFRRDANGVPRLLEVNPRIPGTIGLTVAAGLNLPLLACCQALGDSVTVPPAESGVRVMRYYGAVFARHTAPHVTSHPEKP